VLTGLGDPGALTYKKSRIGDAPIDRAVAKMLHDSGLSHRILDFSPYGYDERQYCSPGFNLPVGRLSRTPFAEYPEYHSSADNLDFVQPDALGESFGLLRDIAQTLELDRTCLNLRPFCEPQLGKRGLYESIEGDAMALLWVLNLADGSRSLLDIAERSGLSFASVLRAKDALAKNDLLREMES
jgi:aminopeptidase-like protein